MVKDPNVPTAEYMLGGFRALQRYSKDDYIRGIQQTAIGYLLNKLTGGREITFTLAEYREVLAKEPALGYGFLIKLSDDAGGTVSLSAATPEEAAMREALEDGWVPEAEA